MHLVWKADFDNGAAYTRASIVNAKVLASLEITGCRPLSGRLPDLRLELTSESPPADYFGAGPLFVISKKLRNIFDEIGANAEYHPVALFKNGLQLECESYYFANLLDKIDCFDFAQGICSLDGEFIDKIEKLAIDANKTDGKQIFRLAKSYDVITLASQNLAGAILSAGLTGVQFIAPSEWKW